MTQERISMNVPYTCEHCGKEVGLNDRRVAIPVAPDADGDKYRIKRLCIDCIDEYIQCSLCGIYELRTDGMVAYNDGFACSMCSDKLMTCDQCGTVFDSSTSSHMFFGDEVYCHTCARETLTTCSSCGGVILRDDAIRAVSSSLICQDCYDDSYFTCDECEGVDHCNNMHYVENDEGDEIVICGRCYSSNENYINSYSYVPRYNYYKTENETPEWYFGIELEVDSRSSIDNRYGVAKSVSKRDKIYCKSDGSLNYGFEVVTHPMTLNYYKNNQIIEYISNNIRGSGLQSHNTTTCGLHVHVSRKNINSENIYNIHMIYEKLWDEIKRFSRRTDDRINQWASRYQIDLNDSVSMTLDKAARNRYRAINIQPDHTIEFRVFRGTTKVSTIYATLQFCDMVVRMSKTMTLQEIYSMTWQTLIDMATELGYNDFIQYSIERELYTQTE